MATDYNFLKCDSSVEETTEFLMRYAQKRFSEDDCNLIQEALDTARQAHGKQIRDNGDLYIIHPIRVAILLLIFEDIINVDIVIAALLHDTLEDTSLEESEISQRFDEHVLKLVLSVTRRHSMETLQEKQQAKFEMWEKIMQASQETRAIKTFDALDNMICWKTIPEAATARKKIPRWLHEAQIMSLPLARITNSQAYTMLQEQYEYYVRSGHEDQPITN